MNRRIRDIALVLGMAMTAIGAQASLVTYAGLRTTGIAPPSGLPLDARNNFLAGLGNAGTETFSSFSVGQPAGVTLGISFAGNGNTATISGDDGSGHANFAIDNNAGGNPNGRYDTTGSGEQFLETAQGAAGFLISFANATHAFGLYMTDVGDFGQGPGVALSWILTDTFGSTTEFQVASTDVADASLQFFGFIDADKAYKSIQFVGSGSDGIGLDDMIVGDLPSAEVPEPASIVLVVSALLTLAAVRRRRR